MFLFSFQLSKRYKKIRVIVFYNSRELSNHGQKSAVKKELSFLLTRSDFFHKIPVNMTFDSIRFYTLS
ncbi:protein of unknown function [Ruminococcaceae bacterium BL-4]|nr:protein of unknown function [Ruminococcaceae bacterium BL-4]